MLLIFSTPCSITTGAQMPPSPRLAWNCAPAIPPVLMHCAAWRNTFIRRLRSLPRRRLNSFPGRSLQMNLRTYGCNGCKSSRKWWMQAGCCGRQRQQPQHDHHHHDRDDDYYYTNYYHYDTITTINTTTNGTGSM